jgi:hypothetical protein
MGEVAVTVALVGNQAVFAQAAFDLLAKHQASHLVQTFGRSAVQLVFGITTMVTAPGLAALSPSGSHSGERTSNFG